MPYKTCQCEVLLRQRQTQRKGIFKYSDGNHYVAQYDGKIITSGNYKIGNVDGKYYVWKTTGCDELKGWQIFNAEGQMIVPAE